MGEMMGDGEQNAPNIDMGGARETGYSTDVDGVMAHDVVKHGKDEFPCFDIDKDDFFQNMQHGRQRIRFKPESEASKYMKGTKYNRPFFVRHTDDNGKQYVRKVK